MATVTGLTAARMLAIEAASIVSGEIDESGHLILTTYGGIEIDAGYVIDSVPDASEANKGIVELASSAETSALTDTTRAITPGGISAIITAINDAISEHETSINSHETRLDDIEEGNVVAWIDLPPETDAPQDSYPYGISIAQANDDSGELWTPNGGDGTVVTVFITEYRCQQSFYSNGGGSVGVKTWVRTYNLTNGGWSAWARVHLDNDVVTVTRPSSTDQGLVLNHGTPSFPHFYAAADGKMWWGPGTVTQDTTLYRSAAGTLKTDGAMEVVGDFSIESRSQGRGVVAFNASSSTSSFIGSETAIITISSVTFKAGRAYKIEYEVDVDSSTTGNSAEFRIRRNTVSGTVLRFAAAHPMAGSSGFGSTCRGSATVRNSTGSDITDNVVLTLASIISGTVRMSAASNRLGTLTVTDIGAASAFSTATSL